MLFIPHKPECIAFVDTIGYPNGDACICKEVKKPKPKSQKEYSRRWKRAYNKLLAERKKTGE